MLKKILLSIFIIICVFICFAAIILHRLFDSYDDFAKDLTIPEGVEYLEPLATQPQNADNKQGFILYNGVQPGVYRYELNFIPSEQGYIYFQAYEVTTNQQLSASRLKKRSQTEITNTSTSQEKYAGEFSIYEGNWGEYYLARFEVWFAPLDGGNERKLFEEIYKVEGWQR